MGDWTPDGLHQFIKSLSLIAKNHGWGGKEGIISIPKDMSKYFPKITIYCKNTELSTWLWFITMKLTILLKKNEKPRIQEWFTFSSWTIFG